MSQYNMVHKPNSIVQALRDSQGNGCSRQGMEKIAEAAGLGRAQSDLEMQR